MKNLIRQTLERDFDLPQYTDFVRNLFNEIKIQPQEIKVPDSSKEFIKKITFISDFSDAQKKTIDVYAVELAGGTKVERARSFQRNLISKLLKDNTKDAGLVAFYSQDNPDWRLSFIKLDYKLTDKGVKVEIGTPPKRYSFLVGKSEPSHTAQKQLLPILEDHKNNPLLLDLEEAFSVERVTKEFYERYRKLFEDLSKDLKKNIAFQIIAEKENIDIDNFAKKLLGQIVFLYFLQKKGWLGVPQDKTWGQGDKFFLRTLFDKVKAGKQDFYDYYLEHLFYDTLNNPRRDEVDPAYSRYFNCKIPFLNGGLFEPDYNWKDTIVYLGNTIFEEIIDTFDLYNFTVKEDEPLEKEVAVDPEMLGKVFENLLPENMRKGQGAYYTPREIVHYMCQESLINHLNTETKIDAERIRKLIAFKDEDLVNVNGSRKIALGFSDDEAQGLDLALANIKVCDPACGSGAFLVGMLNEIVSARRILEPRSEYKLKKEVIQECIYGVDIDPGAVDIAKLRLWLTLVVDFELRDIEPLPNLDYKIMCGNSLLEELIVGDESIKLFDERLLNFRELKSNLRQDERQEELKKQLQEKQKELRDLYDANKLSMVKKHELDSEILAINKELNPKSKKIKTEAYHPVFFADQADEYFKRLKDLHKQFFTEYDPIKKKERRKQIEEIELEFIKSSIKEKVNEFDTKIKNLNIQDVMNRKKQVELMKKKLEYSAIPEQIRNSKTRPYFLWKLNFFEVFQEKGGFDVVIANPPYGANIDNLADIYRVRYFESIKNYADIFKIFFNLGLNICKDSGVQTLITPNTYMSQPRYKDLRQYLLNYRIVSILNLGEKVFDSVDVPVAVSIIRKSDPERSFLFCDLSVGCKFTGELNKINYTVVNQGDILVTKDLSFFNFVQLRNNEIHLDDILWVKDAGIQYHRSGIGLKNKGGSDLYSRIFSDKKTTFEKCTHTWYGKLIDTYYIQNHTDEYFNLNYKDILKPNESVSFSVQAFNQSTKIIWRQTASYIRATLDEQKRWFRNTIQCGWLKEEYKNRIRIKYILAVLNSSYLRWLYNKIVNEEGRVFPQVKVTHVKKLPIKLISINDQDEIINIVDKILIITEGDDYLINSTKQAKVKEYERQVDQMVYKLYGLSQEEIDIIERS